MNNIPLKQANFDVFINQNCRNCDFKNKQLPRFC